MLHIPFRKSKTISKSDKSFPKLWGSTYWTRVRVSESFPRLFFYITRRYKEKRIPLSWERDITRRVEPWLNGYGTDVGRVDTGSSRSQNESSVTRKPYDIPKEPFNLRLPGFAFTFLLLIDPLLSSGNKFLQKLSLEVSSGNSSRTCGKSNAHSLNALKIPRRRTLLAAIKRNILRGNRKIERSRGTKRAGRIAIRGFFAEKKRERNTSLRERVW